MVSKKKNDKFRIKMQNLSSTKTLVMTNSSITHWKKNITKQNSHLFFKMHFN